MLVGYVTGSREISPYEFYMRLRTSSDGSIDFMPQVEDIVKTEFEYPGWGRVTAYGVVTEISSMWDGEPMMGFEETLAIEKMVKRVLRTYVARVVITRLISEKGESPDVPPIPGSPVYLIRDQGEVDEALGFKEVRKRGKALPVGLLKNGSVAYLDLDYILGENGAHVNISGQSGVASKSSYMMFLVKSIRDTARVTNDPVLKRSVFIIFNVKGQSLMFIDKFSSKWREFESSGEADHWKRMYEKMNLSLQPFDNVEFYAVRKSSVSESPDSLRSDAKPYWWTTDEIFDLDLFEMLFDPEELMRNNNLMLAVMMISDFMNPESERDRQRRRMEIKNAFDLIRALENEDSELYGFLSSGDLRKSTMKLLKRRLQLALKMGLDRLWGVRFSDENRINWQRPGWISVIDVSRLRTKMQAFVVGAVLKDIMRNKEKGRMLDIPVFVLVDELNKYSPRGERSEIASVFRDVAERGRSFGVILVGAEQTASEVDYRVITQSATTIVGRQKWVELHKGEYGHLIQEQKRKASTLKQGEMIVDQPFLRLPLTVTFPFPVWALNERDAISDSSDDDLLV